MLKEPRNRTTNTVRSIRKNIKVLIEHWLLRVHCYPSIFHEKNFSIDPLINLLNQMETFPLNKSETDEDGSPWTYQLVDNFGGWLITWPVKARRTALSCPYFLSDDCMSWFCLPRFCSNFPKKTVRYVPVRERTRQNFDELVRRPLWLVHWFSPKIFHHLVRFSPKTPKKSRKSAIMGPCRW